MNFLNLIDVEVGRCGSTDLVVFFDHVEREDNVVSVQVFTVGPLDAFADLNGPFGKVFVRGAHIGCNFRELLTGNGVHFPKVCAHQLMNTEVHVRTGHVAVELARSVGRRRSLNDQSFVTVRANRRNLTCGGMPEPVDSEAEDSPAALLVLSVEPEDAALLVLPPPPQPLRMPVTSMAADRRTAKVFFFIIQYLSCFVNLRFIMC